MYRINDRTSAIKRVQEYLRVVGNKNIIVAPTGIYDENTRLSVIDFQSNNSIKADGIVDVITFDLLFDAYDSALENELTHKKMDSFIRFPLLPGLFSDEMFHINRILISLLNFYGQPNSLSESNFYSDSTSNAVKMVREIYLLDDKNFIDEELYRRMIIDHDSIFEAKDNFNQL